MSDSSIPLDRVILGLEEYMGDVIDARPDRFLREMREHGTWDKACENAGLTREEVEELCASNQKFDLAQVECQLEFIEEALVANTEKVITEARRQRAVRISQIRDQQMEAYRRRHG